VLVLVLVLRWMLAGPISLLTARNGDMMLLLLLLLAAGVAVMWPRSCHALISQGGSHQPLTLLRLLLSSALLPPLLLPLSPWLPLFVLLLFVMLQG
jgi:hypothetical protein